MATRTDHRWMSNVLAHKALVGVYLTRVIALLTRRAVEHDFSKFAPEEFGPYAKMLPRLEKTVYGTPENQACYDEVQPALEHHFAHNRHHPEHFPNGVNDMTLLDVLEMCCDWVAASQRTPGTPVRLDLQRLRFQIDDQLYGIIVRTVVELLAEDQINVHS